jgi:hypothetical protein
MISDPPKNPQNIVFPAHPDYDNPLEAVWGTKTNDNSHLQFVLKNKEQTNFKTH